ncbi:MAG: hypothetical protein ABR600_13025 [Actinomycetota bacterium]
MTSQAAVKEVTTLARRALNDDLPMGALAALVQLRTRLGEAERASIEGARARGASWEDIATTLGVTRQALHQRMQRVHRRAG